jgi:DNA processing protein
MEASIQQLACLYAQQPRTELEIFLRAAECLRSGEVLFSKSFLQLVPELEPLAVKTSRTRLGEILTEQLRSQDQGQRLLYPGHPMFPKSYLELEEVPYLLRLKGDPIWLRKPGIAVVGSREPSYQSTLWMDRHLTDFLRKTNCFTVSGGARGIDQKTHLISLLTGNPTVVLVPSGLRKLYPSSLLDLQNEILKQGGAFLSEYEDLMPMNKRFFVQRNRLISGLGKATLVIEAKWKSGTMLTAQEAVEQHRPVWVLPGHPMDPMMQGSLNLLYEGAALVRDAQDLSLLFDTEVPSLTEHAVQQGKHLVEVSSSQH